MALTVLVALTLALLVTACHPSVRPDREGLLADAGVYAYPFDDALTATVVGTPPDRVVPLPGDIPIEEFRLRIVDDRPVPAIFWYEDGFRFSLAPQRGPAPLLFVIGGTNAGYRSRLSLFLQRLFFMAGFHVVSLSSPTFPNFMVAASQTGVPGRISQDSADLYLAMQMALARINRRVEVTDRYLMGYSLGGWQAAFVARIDDQLRALRFRKVLLINPPVSLYRSSIVLDRLLTDNVPGGVAGIEAFVNQVLARLTTIFQSGEQADFAQDLLYRAYLALRPTSQQLAALVGIAFRLSSANVAFTADVLSNSGFLVPPERRLTVSTSLTPYFYTAMQHGFVDYFDDLLFPFYRAREPGLTREDMVAEASLESIEPFLVGATHIGMITNVDDVILAPGDIDFLRRVFATRATIFPNGGHCGNMRDQYVAAAMVRFMTE